MQELPSTSRWKKSASPTTRYGDVVQQIRTNQLASTQAQGFYRTDYLKDGVDHFTDPPIVIIKPNYRASKPQPGLDPLATKALFSNHPFGEPKHKQVIQNSKHTTLRSTMQGDSVYYR